VGRWCCGERLHARQVISGNQGASEESQWGEGAVVSACMQGRSSVAIKVPPKSPSGARALW